VIARLSSPAFRERLEASATDPGVDDLYRQISKLESVANDLASALGAEELDRRAFKVATERNMMERRAVEREIRARVGERSSVLADPPTTEAALLAWWADATVAQGHALTAAVIDEIRVLPAARGRRFDPDRLEIEWREQDAGARSRTRPGSRRSQRAMPRARRGA
jgi:hypothetical protein